MTGPIINQFGQSTVQGALDLTTQGTSVSARVSPNIGAGVTLVAGQAVKLDTAVNGGVPAFLPLAANSDTTFGFVIRNIKDQSDAVNQRFELAMHNSIMYMTAGGTITRGDKLEVVYTTNKVITNAGTNPVIGFAYDNAVANDLLRVFIVTPAWNFSQTIANIAGLQTALDALGAGVNEGETTITTVGNGTLTAAGIAGQLITRSGPTGAFSDATDTAAAVYALIPGVQTGQAFEFKIKNSTAFAQTITAGTGVTLPAAIIIPPNSVATYLWTVNSSTTATVVHVHTTALTNGPLEVITALSTVGAGTITGAGIAGGITNRTGSTAAYTDTTDTATNIIAAMPNARIGASFEYTYFNNTGQLATITGGSGVTVSGLGALVQPGTWTRFLVTYTAAGTITMVAFATGYLTPLPPAQFATGTTTTTFLAGQLSGAAFTTYANTGATPGSIATRTATQMIADIPNAYVGMTYLLRVQNAQGTGTLTITAGTGVTLTGTATVAANTTRDFVVTITNIGTPAITFQNVGAATFS